MGTLESGPTDWGKTATNKCFVDRGLQPDNKYTVQHSCLNAHGDAGLRMSDSISKRLRLNSKAWTRSIKHTMVRCLLIPASFEADGSLTVVCMWTSKTPANCMTSAHGLPEMEKIIVIPVDTEILTRTR